MIKRIIVDIDDTLTLHNSSREYALKKPRVDVLKKLKEYKEMGYEIILYSARNMKTFDGNLAKINKHTLPKLMEWLDTHNIEFDGIIMGKPWCGEMGFYIDDKAIRPDEFVNMSEEDIHKMVGNLK
jgi:capsule biosynthesis phosphatase